MEPVAGWRRWFRSDPEREGRQLVSRTPEGVTPSRSRLQRIALLRHPGLARVIDAEFSLEGARVIEETGDARPLSDGRCRLPRGDALAEGLLMILEGVAYLQRQEVGHGAVSRDTIFSDGKRLMLTGAALNGDGLLAAADDICAWARITTELLENLQGSELTDVVREAASQVLAAEQAGRSLDAPRVVRAINRAMITDETDPDVEDVADRSEQAIATSRWAAVGQFVGSAIIGLFTSLLTVAVIAAVVAGGVLWFLDQLPAEVPVPNVVGMERDEAGRALEAEGLSMGRVRQVYREEVEPGRVAETMPPPGMTVREGREVTLVVSMGAARVSVPRLTGLKLAEAERVLESKGLHLVDGGKRRSNMPEGEIVEQDPPPTRKIAQGERVVVETSGGPEYGMVEVPGEDEGDEPRRLLFRRIEIVVPRGDALQRVEVREGYGDDLETAYDRLHRPGDRVKLDTYGRPGKQIRVSIEGEQVFKTEL
ncbi:MAG: PASTA domain-containing protein [Armatimonadota bacterium]